MQNAGSEAPAFAAVDTDVDVDPQNGACRLSISIVWKSFLPRYIYTALQSIRHSFPDGALAWQLSPPSLLC